MQRSRTSLFPERLFAGHRFAGHVFAGHRLAPFGLGLERAKSRPAVPWLLTGSALLTGVVVARAIDWRGHAHPRL